MALLAPNGGQHGLARDGERLAGRAGDLLVLGRDVLGLFGAAASLGTPRIGPSPGSSILVHSLLVQLL